MKIALVDYGAGNTKSVQFAIERLGYQAVLTSDAKEIRSADRVIFPGVGQAAHAMKAVHESKLNELLPSLKQPLLGVCLGMQLLFERLSEGDCEGLGMMEGEVAEFSIAEKVPHMGWNTIHNLKSPLFEGINEGAFVYFVHSYYVPQQNHTIASTDYGLNFSAAVQKNNFYGCQFHPEKSGDVGLRILKNFIELCG